jgi:hypothetical protein
MQTFTPYSDFEESLRALDLKRLGKQRVEVIQIVRALTVPGYAWSSHPAVLMWKGYEEALGRYGLTSCEVWTERGFGDSCAATIAADLRAAGIAKIRSYEQLAANDALPPWLFDEAVQLSHRSSLLRKDPEHYGPLFPSDTPRDLYYVWPVRSPAVIERELRKEETPGVAPSRQPRCWCRRRWSGAGTSAAGRPRAAGRHGSRRRSGRPSGCAKRLASSAGLLRRL